VQAGERVVDVPAKLAARVRLFDTGHNRKTDALDAQLHHRQEHPRVPANDEFLQRLEAPVLVGRNYLSAGRRAPYRRHQFLGPTAQVPERCADNCRDRERNERLPR
jgi:hypothetical protein